MGKMARKVTGKGKCLAYLRSLHFPAMASPALHSSGSTSKRVFNGVRVLRNEEPEFWKGFARTNSVLEGSGIDFCWHAFCNRVDMSLQCLLTSPLLLKSTDDQGLLSTSCSFLFVQNRFGLYRIGLDRKFVSLQNS